MALFQLPFFPLALLLLIIFGHFLEAADLSTHHPPQGPLGIRLDYALARPGGRYEKSHRWVFSSYLQFNNDIDSSSITDGQLMQMAIDGHREMIRDLDQYNPNRRHDNKPYVLPGVMTIMAFDNKIILASSQKGKDGFIDGLENSPVQDMLNFCQSIWRDTDAPEGADPTLDHMHDRKCGEVSAFHQYYQYRKEHRKDISNLEPKARVTTVNQDIYGVYQIIPPCGETAWNKWGCDLLTKHFNVNYIGTHVQPQPYNLNQIAGGVKRKGQIQSCRKNVLWLREQ